MGLVKSILKDELTAIRDKYGDERRTSIETVSGEVDIEDLIPEETCVFTLTHEATSSARRWTPTRHRTAADAACRA